jgi:hypothetical protein
MELLLQAKYAGESPTGRNCDFLSTLFAHRRLLSSLAALLMILGVALPLAHELSCATDHEHHNQTCEFCRTMASTHAVLVSAAPHVALPDSISAIVPLAVSREFVPAFDYAVAHPRGPPSCSQV